MSTVKELSECEHCGTPFNASKQKHFCCRGCEYVSKLIHQNELGRFYEIKGKDSLPPVGSSVFAHHNLQWTKDAQKAFESKTENEIVRGEFHIDGISCIGCVWLIDAIFKRKCGAIDSKLDAQSGQILLIWRRDIFKLKDFAEALSQLNYHLTPAKEDAKKSPASRQLVSRIGICAFLLLNTMLFTLPGYLGMSGDYFLSPLFHILGALFASMSMIVGGGYFIRRAWHSLLAQVLHIDLPISFGLIAAYLGSIIGWVAGYTSLIYFDFVSTFVFLMLVGRWLQEYTLERNHALLRKKDWALREVILMGGPRDGERIAVEHLKTDDVYSVDSGAINPVAAELLEPAATFSMEWINGEPEPVVWSPHKIVPAGVINLSLTRPAFKARESWRDSTLYKLLSRSKTAFENKRLQSILKYYILIVLIISSLGGLGWVAFTGDLLLGFQVLTSILVVSCPCALGVALPLCNAFANARLRKLGLFIKTNDIWERLRKVHFVVFDKTGTLTMSTPRILNETAIQNLDDDSLKALFALVDRNAHPLARSIREVLLAQNGKPTLPSTFNPVTEYIGHGVAWHDAQSNRWTLGQPEWEATSTTPEQMANRSAFRKNGDFITGFDFAEDIRDDARLVRKELQKQNLEIAILSGDISKRVQQVARMLDLPPHLSYSNCSSKDKAHWIESHAYNSALMIGDGANDRLAFEKAICRGTPVAEEGILEDASDFFFFGRSPTRLTRAF